jgi:stage II sporulation protein D
MANQSRGRPVLPLTHYPMLASAHKPRLFAPLALLVAASLLLLAAPAAADAQVIFKVKGRGFGHGVGMSQWGAKGLAEQGKGHKRILRHYYKDTKVGTAKTERVRVLLSVRPRAVRFRNARKACGRRVQPDRTYRARLSPDGRKVRLERGGRKLTSCGRKLGAKPAGNIVIKGDGVYRGELVARAASGSLNVINRVKLEGYLKGVVPGEVPTSWPAAALRAQAVAARSYALATGVNGAGYDLYDDTRSQVYGGVAAEQRSTNRAVARTRAQVVKYRGETIPAFFFSSSGGRTENVEHGFPGGSPRPYLKSVKDPTDRVSPHHRWTERFTRKQMQRALGDLVRGRLRNIRVTKRGESPRIVKAKLIGSNGNRTVTGDTLRFRLELRSTWAKFEKVRR